MAFSSLAARCLLVSALFLGTCSAVTELFTETCTAVVMLSTDNNKSLQCRTPSRHRYLVPSVDKRWITKMQASGDLISGKTILDLPAGTMANKGTYELLLQEPPILVNEDADFIRRLSVADNGSGTKTTLVIKLVLQDAAPKMTEAVLSDKVFGTDGDAVNLKSQMKACSHDKLIFEPLADQTGITDGVTTISVPVSLSDGDLVWGNAGFDELINRFGFSIFDSVDYFLWIFPDADFLSYAGVADLDGANSWYNGDFALSSSLQMHELGHNLGLDHASKGNDEYGDIIGVMGDADLPDDYKLCFVGPKTWALGWFSDKTFSFTPGEGGFQYEWSGKIGSFVKYDSSANDVIAEIPQITGLPNFYVSFNWAEDFNSDTEEAQNLVVIHEAMDMLGLSYQKATLAAGESYSLLTARKRGFDNNKDKSMIVTVDAIDVANGNADITIQSVEPLNPDYCLLKAQECDCAVDSRDRPWRSEVSYVGCVKKKTRKFGCDLAEVIDQAGCLPDPDQPNNDLVQPSCNSVADLCSCVGSKPGRPWKDDMQYFKCVSKEIKRAKKYCDLDAAMTRAGTCLPISPTTPTCDTIADTACPCAERSPGRPWVSQAQYDRCVLSALRKSKKYCPLQDTLDSLACVVG